MKLSFLYGSDLKLLRKRLRHYGIDWNAHTLTYLPLHYLFGLYNSLFQNSEPDTSQIEVKKPVFILGHFRCGTTHLHNLMSVDGNYVAPNTFQVSFPRIFLRHEKYLAPILQLLSPNTRPQDNMRLKMKFPQEDEIALIGLGTTSPYMAAHFPNAIEDFRKYIDLDLEEKMLDSWKLCHLNFAKKLSFTLKDRQYLVFKSPCHMARVKHILELYPDARFIHIHRDPWEVAHSSLKMYQSWFKMVHFQDTSSLQNSIEEIFIDNYSILYDAYFKQKELIPKGNLYEFSYNELISDRLGTIRNIYQFLGDREVNELKFKEYCRSISNYKRNTYESMNPELRQRLSRHLQRVCQTYSYNL